MSQKKVDVLPPLKTSVIIIGGGVSGIWVGLKLARAGIPTLIVSYHGKDRGGIQGSTAKSVGAINLSPIEHPDFRAFLEDLGLGQHHPDVTDVILTRFPHQLAEIKSLVEFKNIKLGIALKSGSGAAFLEKMYAEFESRGGKILDAWVTRLVIDDRGPRGVQYEKDGAIGQIQAGKIVIASGGYTGLFEGSVKTNNYGSMLGAFLRSGGLASNLEFIFKHGYGQPDLGALTPTEELPGAEIYDSDKNHVVWLERELFEGRGTANHLEAFKHWRRHKDKDFFIDLTYRDVYRRVNAINIALTKPAEDGSKADTKQPMEELLALAPPSNRPLVAKKIQDWINGNNKISFEMLEELKPLFKESVKGAVFRVRQIAYFSMGGIAHNRFATNLPGVYVTGEAMHDFGAHRVGGLPWGLYLASGSVISDELIDQIRTDPVRDLEFELTHETAAFEPEMLQEVRHRLYLYSERDLNVTDAERFLQWIRDNRRRYVESKESLHDAVTWLFVAEAIMESSLCRRESRGCFYRADYPVQSDPLSSRYSCAYYDDSADKIRAQLVTGRELEAMLGQERWGWAKDAVAG
jgi:fatty acid CoA ligase FadD22